MNVVDQQKLKALKNKYMFQMDSACDFNKYDHFLFVVFFSFTQNIDKFTWNQLQVPLIHRLR